jgi:hypothetical protein
VQAERPSRPGGLTGQSSSMYTFLTFSTIATPLALTFIYATEIINRGPLGVIGAMTTHLFSYFGPGGFLLHFAWDFIHACLNFRGLTLPEIPQDNRKISGALGLAALFGILLAVYTNYRSGPDRADDAQMIIDTVDERRKKLYAKIDKLINGELNLEEPTKAVDAKVESGYGDPVPEEIVKRAVDLDKRMSSQAYTNIDGAPTNGYIKHTHNFMPNVGTSKARLAKIQKNIKKMTWCDNSFSMGTLIGNLILTSTHSVRTNDEDNVEFVIHHEDEQTKMTLKKECVRTFGEIAFIVTTKVFPQSLNMSYLWELDSSRPVGRVQVFGIDSQYELDNYSFTANNQPVYINIKYDSKRGPGSSGSPIILLDEKSMHIIGVHVGSTNTDGFGLRLKMTHLLEIKQPRPLKYGGFGYAYDDKLSLDYNTTLQLHDVNERSIVKYIENAQLQTLFPTMVVAGQLTHSFGVEKSRFVETPLKQHLDSSQYSTEKYTIPEFKHRVVSKDGIDTWIHPHLKNLSYINTSVNFIRQDWLCDAIPQLAVLLKRAAKFSLKPPLTLQQSMNGIPGILNSIDLSTSGGPGYPGTKADWVKGVHPNLYPNEKIMTDVENLLDIIDTGHFIRPVYRASLKDEILSKEKNEEGRVRQFYGCNIPIQILTRMLFAPMFIWMAQNRHQLPFKIGVNATSAEWEQIYREFVKRGNYYESDIKAFDKKNTFQHLGIMIMIELMFLYGYTPDQIARALLLGWSNVYYFLDVMGVILEMFACAPSGAPGTTYNNSFTVLFVLFMAYVISLGLYKKVDFVTALFMQETFDFFQICLHMHLW